MIRGITKIVLLGLLIMQDAQSIEYKSPEFRLKLAVTGVGVDIRLNDISVEFDDQGGHSTMIFDVNESIIAGMNELKVIVFPFFEDRDDQFLQTTSYHEEAEVKATLLVNEKGDEERQTILSQIHLKPRLPLDEIVVIDNKEIKLERVSVDNKSQPLSFPYVTYNHQIVASQKTLPVQDNYPRWAWQDGKNIENTKDEFDSLLLMYKKIHEAHKRGDKNELITLQNDAAIEFSKAYGLSGVNEGHNFIGTGEILNNNNYELHELHTDGSKLDVFANGKLARIVDAGFYHPVVYLHKTEDLIYKLKFAFYKNQNNEWVMIR